MVGETTTKVVGSLAPGLSGSSVRVVASLVPLPSKS